MHQMLLQSALPPCLPRTHAPRLCRPRVPRVVHCTPRTCRTTRAMHRAPLEPTNESGPHIQEHVAVRPAGRLNGGLNGGFCSGASWPVSKQHQRPDVKAQVATSATASFGEAPDRQGTFWWSKYDKGEPRLLVKSKLRCCAEALISHDLQKLVHDTLS